MNRITTLFERKKKNLLSIYFTAGFPALADTELVLEALQKNGADIIEIGIPYSDPLADGPVIQHSSMQALSNGISIKKIFEQIRNMHEHGRRKESVPYILMGYLNPVMQYGLEKFVEEAKNSGIDGLILPDLPIDEFDENYRDIFEKNNLKCIFLVTPETAEARIRQIDALSSGFIYAVSSSAITGSDTDFSRQESYFKRLEKMSLLNPIMIGFGIRDAATFNAACKYAAGAIIGTAYIKAIETSIDLEADTAGFLNAILKAGMTG
ncbi:MAG: tryptophan synthase subunit alpha [Ginsengibacter sp.]